MQVRHAYGPHVCGETVDIDPQHNLVLTGSWRRDNALQVTVHFITTHLLYISNTFRNTVVGSEHGEEAERPPRRQPEEVDGADVTVLWDCGVKLQFNYLICRYMPPSFSTTSIFCAVGRVQTSCGSSAAPPTTCVLSTEWLRELHNRHVVCRQ